MDNAKNNKSNKIKKAEAEKTVDAAAEQLAEILVQTIDEKHSAKAVRAVQNETRGNTR